jgi:CO/xanthine dehydrogenase Mo-binding subunit
LLHLNRKKFRKSEKNREAVPPSKIPWVKKPRIAAVTGALFLYETSLDTKLIRRYSLNMRKDHRDKIEGTAQYVGDIRVEGMVFAKMLRSEKAFGEIKKISLPPLPEGYTVVDASDVPPLSPRRLRERMQPLFAGDEVCFIGEAILMLLGPDEEILSELLGRIEVEYLEKDPVLSAGTSPIPLVKYHYTKGDPETAFSRAAQVIEEDFETGYQEHAYIEPQGMLAVYRDGDITIYGAMQNPYYIKDDTAEYLGLDNSRIHVVQAVTGGGFGGKEDFTSVLAAQAAAAALKVKKPVRLVLERKEDMAITPKRHPSSIHYRVALDGEGNICAVDADICLDAGAYAVCTPVVLQRSMIVAVNGYTIDHLNVNGRAMITNTAPTGAFRGFGAPQSIFSMEMLMEHLAARLGISPLEIRKRYVAKKGDATSTNGCYHDTVKAYEMLEKAAALSDFSRKHRMYKTQTGRYRKGIGISVFLHGCGFTGSAEKDFLKSVVQLVKHEDDRVEILASNTEIGQGVKTTFCEIVGRVLNIPPERVIFEYPVTSRVPNSGPTVASRSIMIVGKLLERAALRLKKEWAPHVYQSFTEHYVHPELIPWDLASFSGDAYPTYSWGVNVVEVELDTATAVPAVTGLWAVFDVGVPIDEAIARGQVEGGMLQGIGFGSMEKMAASRGRLQQASFTDYTIPTAMDTAPVTLEFVENPYENGPFGAKGMGELTLLGGAPAYAAAVENAAGARFFKAPVTPEEIMEKLEASP